MITIEQLERRYRGWFIAAKVFWDVYAISTSVLLSNAINELNEFLLLPAFFLHTLANTG